MWVWQKLPRLHCVGISDTFRKFWSACCCLMTGLERMWNHWWWQTSAFTIHPFCETPSLSTGALQLYWPCLLLHREDYCHLWRFAIERKRERAKLPFEGSWRIMWWSFLPVPPGGSINYESREWICWESHCFDAAVQYVTEKMKSKISSFFGSWITTERPIRPALRPHWWR